MSLRVVFMGTPDFSVLALKAVLGDGHDVVAAYSQPPRRSGRGMKERKSPVHATAEAAGIPVFTPTSLNTEDALATFRAHQADVAVVVAYGLILPQAILETPARGCLNIHASLLPRWRGAAPINRAIMAGDRETGVMIMKMDVGLDTGPLACVGSEPCAEILVIGENETAGELHDRLADAGGRAIGVALTALENGTLQYRDQTAAGITYAHKIDKSESRIDWSRGAGQVHDHIRGLSPFPGAWCLMPFAGGSDRVKLLAAERVAIALPQGAAPGTVLDDDLTIACGTGAVRATVLQRAGKQALDRETFLRGHAIPAGARLE